MGGGKKAPGAYTGAEHSNIKQVSSDLGHISLTSKEKFWCKTMVGSPVPSLADM